MSVWQKRMMLMKTTRKGDNTSFRRYSRVAFILYLICYGALELYLGGGLIFARMHSDGF